MHSSVLVIIVSRRRRSSICAERMSEAVPGSDEQVLQNFLTHSAWDYRPVMDQVAKNADHWVGGEVGAGLYVDESAFQD